MFTTLLPLASLALLGPLQGTIDPPQIGSPPEFGIGTGYQFVEWPETGTPWQPGKSLVAAVPGNLTPMPGLEAIIQRGPRIYLLEGLESASSLTTFNQRSPLLMNTVGAVTVAEGVGHDNHDAIISSVVTHGLVVSRYLPASTAEPDFESTVLYSSTDDKRLTRLFTADLAQDDGGQRKDIIGVRENRVFIYRWQADGTWLADPQPITLASDVRDLVALDFDPSPGLELACMADTLEIFANDGTSLQSISTYGDAVARVPGFSTNAPHEPGSLPDCLVVAYTTGSTSWLDIRTSGGGIETLELDVPESEGGPPVSLEVTNIFEGEVNHDECTDLLITHDSYPKHVALLRSPTGTYSPSAESQIERFKLEERLNYPPSITNVGRPGFAVPHPLANRLIITPAETIDPNDDRDGIAITYTVTAVEVDNAQIISSGAPGVHAIQYDTTTDFEELHFILSLPAGFTPSSDLRAEFTFRNQPAIDQKLDPQCGYAWIPLVQIAGDPARYKATLPQYDVIAHHTLMGLTAPAALTPQDLPGPVLWFTLRILDTEIDLVNEVYTIEAASQVTNVAVRLQPETPPPYPSPDDEHFYYDTHFLTEPGFRGIRQLFEFPEDSGADNNPFGAVVSMQFSPPVPVGVTTTLPTPAYPFPAFDEE